MLSVIIPSYHELENIHRAADKISELLDGQEIPYELLFVNDGSADETWACIEKEAADRKNVRGLCFPEILEKSLRYLQALRMQKVTVQW